MGAIFLLRRCGAGGGFDVDGVGSTPGTVHGEEDVEEEDGFWVP